MILLDTNVVSEVIKERADPSVAAFVRACVPDEVFLPSLVVAEIRDGLNSLPAGQRRRLVEQSFESFLREGFGARVVVFDAACAEAYANLRQAREAMGRRVETIDALIGGTALAHGAVLATRNTGDFDGYGLRLVNPWEAAT